MQDLKQITSTYKIIALLADVNIITNVFFVLTYEFILNVVTTLVSLKKRLPSSGLITLMFSIFFYSRNQTDMFPVHNQLMFCTSYTISNAQHSTLHSQLLYLFSLCVHKNCLAKILLSGTFKLHGEVKRIIIY